MQIIFKKKPFFFLLNFLVYSTVWSQSNDLQKIDSLFKANNFDKIISIVENQKNYNQNQYSKELLLKIAFIYEKKVDYIKTLYYLNIAYGKSPSTNLLNKINDIAVKNNLEGYETDDWGFIVILIKNYLYYIFIIFFLLGIYVFSVILVKFQKKEFIPIRHKVIVVLYLVSLILVLNTPKTYKSGIIGLEKSFLRESASSASPVLETIKKGNKVNIIGEKDEWLRIFWNKKICFVRKIDVLIIS